MRIDGKETVLYLLTVLDHIHLHDQVIIQGEKIIWGMEQMGRRNEMLISVQLISVRSASSFIEWTHLHNLCKTDSVTCIPKKPR